MVNVVNQWHPLRFAEDFAIAHNMSGGRLILGVGRGTVPREAELLGSVIPTVDMPTERIRELDEINRERFEEIMTILDLAFHQESFVFHGKHFHLPPYAIEDRGGFFTELTLVPRPKYPFEVWQAVLSDRSVDDV